MMSSSKRTAPEPAPTRPPTAGSTPTRWLGENGRVAYRDALNQLREQLPEAQLLFPDLGLAPEPFARQVAGIVRTTRLLLKCRGCGAESEEEVHCSCFLRSRCVWLLWLFWLWMLFVWKRSCKQQSQATSQRSMARVGVRIAQLLQLFCPKSLCAEDS